MQKVTQVAALSIALSACAGQRSADGGDGAAVAACRGVLVKIGSPEDLATTVQEVDHGFIVSGWRDGEAEGKPDYLREVARDDGAERGVAVVKIQMQDGSGAYRSTMDIEFDDDA